MSIELINCIMIAWIMPSLHVVIGSQGLVVTIGIITTGIHPWILSGYIRMLYSKKTADDSSVMNQSNINIGQPKLIRLLQLTGKDIL